MSSEDLAPELVRDLGKPEAYPDDPTANAGVEYLQTHISHLFLTASRVVKLRKAVVLPFVDFSARAERVADCEREVALNRRLAPDVYLGVAPIFQIGGHWTVRERWLPDSVDASAADLPECAVVMRRLPEGRDALTLLERGELTAEHIDAVATTLARFHDRVGLGQPAPFEPEAWWQLCFGPVADTLESLKQIRPEGYSPNELEALATATHKRFESLRPGLEQRRRDGRAVDGHGDVHLQHIWFEREAQEPVLIDCLEFDAKLRRIDTANEVAFLAMDLCYRGRSDLASRFLRKYAAAGDDFGLFAIVDAYQSYRAAVRAKVAALAARDADIPADQRSAAHESAVRHLALAAETIEERGPGPLVLVCGTVGVGKSTVAQKLAEKTGGVVISSDLTRKHLAGMAPDAHGHDAPDEGLYEPAKVDAIYAALLERADAVVDSGRVAILDATFARASHREKARAWARHRGVDTYLLEVLCKEHVARERLRLRSEAGTDASDAGPELVSISRSRFEPPTEWPTPDHYEACTDHRSDADPLDVLAARLTPPRARRN